MSIARRALLGAAFVAAASAAPALAQTASPTPNPSPSEIGHVTTTDRQEEPLA
ncbi:MAG: hypothetical protein JO349_04640, partial [Candidatus Eremiobacteraeota bacterium]|nr:hypothetical protein [Candidatus Eremiobacteraeota bacterium]